MIQRIRARKKNSSLVLGPYLQWSSHLWDPLLHFHAGDPLTGNQCPSFVATIFWTSLLCSFLIYSLVYVGWMCQVVIASCIGRISYLKYKMLDCPHIALKPLRCLVVGGLIDFLSSPSCFFNGANTNMRGPTAGLQMNLVKNMKKESRN